MYSYLVDTLKQIIEKQGAEIQRQADVIEEYRRAIREATKVRIEDGILIGQLRDKLDEMDERITDFYIERNEGRLQ